MNNLRFALRQSRKSPGFIGLAIGFAAAFLLSRLMHSLLFGVRAGDPLTYLGVSIILSLAAAIACWILPPIALPVSTRCDASYRMIAC